MPPIEEDNWVPAISSEITEKHEPTSSRVSRIEKLPVSTKEHESHPIASGRKNKFCRKMTNCPISISLKSAERCEKP